MGRGGRGGRSHAAAPEGTLLGGRGRDLNPALLLALALAVPSRPVAQGDVLIFTAASLADAVAEAARTCEQRLGQQPLIHAAGTGALAQQIRAGAPADLFFAASLEPLDALVAAGRVRAADVRPVLSNSLVVVVSTSGTLRLTDLHDLRALPRLSLADPESAPAGVYARRLLEAAGLWEALEPSVVPALDVRAALAAVETGLIPAGIVYRTDAARSPRVRVAFEIAPDSGPEIRYGVAPLEGSAHGRAWAECLAGDAARAAYVRHGFLTLDRPAVR